MLYVVSACQTFCKGMAFGWTAGFVCAGAGKERKDTDLMSIQQDRNAQFERPVNCVCE